MAVEALQREPSTAPEATANGLAEALCYVFSHHGRSIGVDDVLARLPHDPLGIALPTVHELAADLDFEAKVVKLPLESIPRITLPVVIIDESGLASVLIAIGAGGKMMVVTPVAGGATRTVSRADLAATYAGVALFLTPRGVTAGQAPREPRGHWFWSVFRTFWRDYTQVALAAFLINLLGLAVPLFIKNVYDRVIPNMALSTLYALTAGIVLALVVELSLRALRAALVDDTGRRVDLVVSSRLFDRLIAARLEQRPGSAGAIASQIRDLDAMRDVLTSSTLIALTDLAFVGIFLAVMWMFAGPLMLVSLAAVIIVLVVAVLIQVPLAATIRKSQADSAVRHGVLVEAAGAIETLKSVAAEPFLRRRWRETVATTSRSMTDARFWANLSNHLVVLVNQSVLVITVIWGVFLVIDGTITVGALIAASILSGRILAPLGNIVQTLARAEQALGAVRALDHLMAAPIELASSGGGQSPRHGDVMLKAVSLTYPGAPSAALVDVTLTIAKGERVGLIGRIGSGKTSLGRVLAGLYQPTSGQLLVDGIDIRQHGADIRSIVGLCLQDVELFSGTLAENLTIGAPMASPEAIEQAVQLAGVDTFAARHPLGLAMPIADRGRTLSGGQRQAIGLARVLIRKPQILFLDEPSASLDTASERALVQRLKTGLADDVTLIISTHRDGMLQLVDRIIVFEGGRVVMDGPKLDVLNQLRGGARSQVTLHQPAAGRPA